MSYEQTMAWGAANYAEVVTVLGKAGLPAEFTQTGGMNAAIVVTLEAEHYLLITDAEDSLSWDPDERVGWYVGLYDARTGDAVRGEQDDDGTTVDDLLDLVRRVMRTRTPTHTDPAQCRAATGRAPTRVTN